MGPGDNREGWSIGEIKTEKSTHFVKELARLGEPSLVAHRQHVWLLQVRQDPGVYVFVQERPPYQGITRGSGQRFVHRPVERNVVFQSLGKATSDPPEGLEYLHWMAQADDHTRGTKVRKVPPQSWPLDSEEIVRRNLHPDSLLALPTPTNLAFRQALHIEAPPAQMTGLADLQSKRPEELSQWHP
jgi:hypothetical protein